MRIEYDYREDEDGDKCVFHPNVMVADGDYGDIDGDDDDVDGDDGEDEDGDGKEAVEATWRRFGAGEKLGNFPS